SEGAQDPVVIELPKGSYALSFHLKSPISSSPGPHPRDHQQIVQNVTQAPARQSRVIISLAVMLAIALGVIAVLLARDNRQNIRVADDIPAAYQVFWRTFVSAPQEPWVIFSNAAFIGRPETGMRYLDSRHDSSALILDHYTGVGEVLAVHELDR